MNAFPTLAGFNQWANGRIYDCVEEMPEADYRLDRGAFFGSIHNTLNHLLLVDRLWTRRIKGKPLGFSSLSDILYDDFLKLRKAQEVENNALIELVNGYGEEDLHTRIVYEASDGTPGERTVWLIFTTLFNHQTHHRGQVHTMLTQSGIKPPDMDVIYYTSEIGVR